MRVCSCNWIMMVAVVLATGCSASSERTTPAPVVEVDLESPQSARQGAAVAAAEQVQVVAYQAPEVAAPEPGNVVFELVDQADSQRRDGDFPGAAATLERALRIEPRNPHLWNRLARIRLEQGRLEMAAELAAKSNNLAVGNPGLQRDNWLIIARARRGAGDPEGARLAEREAKALR